MVRSFFLEFSSKIKFFPLPNLTKRLSTLASQEEEVKKRTVRFGSFCNLVARDLLQFPHKNLNEVELKHDRWNVLNGTKDLPRLEMPECQRQLLFRYFDISIFQGKFLSVYTPRSLLNETCFIEQTIKINRIEQLLMEENSKATT